MTTGPAAGAAVLRTLYALVGQPPYARVLERCELRGTSMSKATITNLLTGNGSPRPRTVRSFVDACVGLRREWPEGPSTAQEWVDAYDVACGRTPVDAEQGLVRVGVRPVPAEALQPRSAIIDLLGSVIDEGRTAVLAQPARVLSGLGGVGKSQLAAAYVGQQWHDPAIDMIVWVDAGSTSGIIEAYAEATTRLFGGSGGDAEQDARRFLRWAATTPKRWLVVLDDLQTPGDLTDWRPPTTPTGQTVITTRYRGDALDRGDVTLVPVDVFTVEESRAYLRERLADHPHLLPGSDHGLATDLGCLPLALAQAAAYLINEATPVGVYRTLFADERRRLDDLVPNKDELPDGHRATVAATWNLSIRRANATAPEGVAWPLLQIAALLAPAGIPEAVFTAEAVGNYLTEALDRDEPLAPHTVRRGLALLHRYNLITFDPTRPDRAVGIHGLVQRATRDNPATGDDRMPPPIDAADLAYATADALCRAWPEIDTIGDVGAILRANATALVHHAGDHLWSPRAHDLLYRIGLSQAEAGQPAGAAAYFDDLSTTAAACLGPDHIDTLVARGNRAIGLGEAGAPGDAVAQLETLLQDMVRVLGADDGDTLTTRQNLARWRGAAGDARGATAEFEVLLADRVRAQGSDYRNTLTTRGDLARWRGEAGDPGGAVAELKALLQDMTRIMGPDNPHTLATRGTLAHNLGMTGDARGAVAELTGLYEAMRRVLGDEHPDTLVARGNIARWRGKAGDVAGAAAELDVLIEDMLRVLGPDHPLTLTARSNLGLQHGEAGDADRASAEYTALLTDRLRALGPDHPSTLITRRDLAMAQARAGDPAGVVADLEALLEDMLRVLGPHHPDTLISRNNLAATRVVAGDVSGAAAELETILGDMLPVLGPHHPDTLVARVNLAVARGRAGDAVGAAAEFRVLIDVATRTDLPATLVGGIRRLVRDGVDEFGLVFDDAPGWVTGPAGRDAH